MIDLGDALWRKSSRSNAEGTCVEVADNLDGVVAVRDSEARNGPALIFTAGAWSSFVQSVRVTLAS